MGSTAALELLIALDAKTASEGLDEIGEKGGGMGDAIKNGAAIAGGAILGLGGILVGATKAAADDEAERARLNNTLKNSIPNWDGNAEAVDALITKGQNLAFTDSEVRDSLGLLVTRTGDLTEAQELQATAMDLARAKGISLEQATKLVGKADDESYAALAKLGIKIDDHATKEEALAQIRASAAGQAETYANSAAGSMERVQNSLGEAFETIGGAILPLVTGPLQSLADWFSSPEVQAGITTIATNIGTFLSGAFTTLSAIITAAWPTVQAVFNFIKDNAGIILGGLALALTAFVIPAFIAWATTMLTVTLPALVATMAPILAAAAPFLALAAAIGLLWLAFESNFMGIRDLVVPIVDTVMAAVSKFWTEMQPKLIEAWSVISSTAVNAWNTLSGWITTGIAALVEGWNTNWGGMRTIIETAWNTISAVVSTAWTIVSGIISAGLSLLSGDWEGAWNGIQTTLSDVWTLITTELLPNALTMIGTLLTEFLPKLIGVLGEWAGAFFNWVYTDILPQLPGWLGSIASALWTWLTETAGFLWTKLTSEWVPGLWNWITGPGGVIETIGPKLGEIASALWTWVTTTASDLWDKLINEWVPKLWEWITGEGGVLSQLGTKLGEIWTAITDWIGTTATDILTAVETVGTNLVDGIMNGITGAWDAFSNWVMGLLGGLLDGVKEFFGIHSPSRVMADVGDNIVGGLQQGMEGAYGGAMTSWMSFFDELWGEASTRAQEIADLMNFGTAGSGGGYAGNGGSGSGGAGGGGRMLGATSVGGGGWSSGGGGHTFNVTINASGGANGRGIAQEFLEELEYALGDQIAIRNGTRSRR